MAAWTANDLLKRHLPHRLGVLRGFRNRSRSESHEAHCAMKDGAMVTCRVLWNLMGVVTYSVHERTPRAPTVLPEFVPFEKQGRYPATLPAGVTIGRFSKAEFDALSCARDIILVLVAANKCVAHLDEYPDHAVSEGALDRVIDVTIAEINSRVS
jgi:hypothetical protein